MNQPNEPTRLIRPLDGRWRISVAAIMALSFGLLVLLSVGGVLTLTLGANYRNTYDLLGARSSLLVDSMEDSLRLHLGRAEDAVDGVAALYAKGVFEIDDAGAMNAVLSGALVGVPSAVGMLIITDDLKSRGAFRQTGKALGDFQISAPQPTTAPDILAAMEGRRRTEGRQWGAFVANEDGIFANVSMPLIRNGVRHGWVIAPVELTMLSTITSELSARHATHAFILYDGNRILADQRLAAPAPLPPGVAPLANLADYGDPVLASFSKRKVLNEFRTASARSVEISEVTVSNDYPENPLFSGDQVYVAMTRTIPGYGPRPWKIGAYYTRSEVGDEILRAWLSGVIGVGALVLSIIAAVMLGKRLARPVRAIADQAQLVAGFELEHVKPLPRSRVLELDDQAVAFNAMLTGLRAFSTYIPRSLVAKLVRSGESDIAQSREAIVTVMFTDIVGFTTLSEEMEAGAVATLLNRHFAILCHAVDEHGGTVDKFLGDGMMAFFGAPDRLKGHGAAAVRAATDMRVALAADNVIARREGRPPLRVRIGIHTGPVIVGNIGASDRVNYTIIGDTVNVSQRLQGLGKLLDPEADVTIVISGETASRLDERVQLTGASKHHLRGRGEPVDVFLVGDVSDQAPAFARASGDAA